jgi:peptidoglycan hydrolase-like protein with peptidoglycan-binding domain
LDRDALDHLADALMEDIATASGDDLLAEVEEDFGDTGVLAVAFDEALAGAEALALRQSREEAIGNLADALREDIAAAPLDALLREVAEDYGDERALAAEFDRAVLGVAVPSGAAGMVGAEASIAGQEVRRQAVRSRAPLRAGFASLPGWLTAPWRSRTAIAAFAALLLIVVVAPRLLERSAVRINFEPSANDALSLPSASRVSPMMSERRRAPAVSELPAPPQPPPGATQETATPPPAPAALGQPMAAPRPVVTARRIAPLPRTEAAPVGDAQQRQDALRQDALEQRDESKRGEAKTNQPDQIRQAQTQLNRLGCFKGKPDGLLNDQTRKAVQAFRTRAGGPVTETGITDELIAELRRQPNGICNAAPPVAAGAPRPAAPVAAPPPDKPAR